MKNNDHVYILREREFIKTNEKIYKIGRTSRDPNNRMSQYPKNSEIFITIKVNNSIIIEREIKKLFNNKYKQRKDIGIEYFEGDCYKMVEDIYKLTRNKKIIKNPKKRLCIYNTSQQKKISKDKQIINIKHMKYEKISNNKMDRSIRNYMF